jgi:DNA modification methylase
MKRPEITDILSLSVQKHINPKNDTRIYMAREVSFDHATGHAPVHSYTKHKGDGSNYGQTYAGISGGGSTERYPRDVLTFKWDTRKENLHPCQKPLEACKYFIKTYTNPGDLVLDSCAGSCTTALAALETRRQFICFEKDKGIFNIGRNRILDTYY